MDRNTMSTSPLDRARTDQDETAQADSSSVDTPLVAAAAYATLAEAHRAAEMLVEAGLKPTEVSVHGTTFRESGEQSLWQQPLLRGSIAGLVGGAVVGLLFGFVSLTSVVSGLFYTVVSEMVLGAATGFLGFMAARARGGFQNAEAPQRFEVMVPAAIADKAAKVLTK